MAVNILIRRNNHLKEDSSHTCKRCKSEISFGLSDCHALQDYQKETNTFKKVTGINCPVCSEVIIYFQDSTFRSA